MRKPFDPHWKAPDRPDRLWKTQELRTLLEFYLNRATRYGLMEEEAVEEARYFLATLAYGYTLEFTRSALIFDFDKPGTEALDHEFGIEIYRIGFDLIEALLEETKPAALGSTETRVPASTPVPRLDAAAFIAPARDRTPTWEGQRKKQRDEEVSNGDHTQETEIPLAADATLDQGSADSEESGTPLVQRWSEDVVQDSSDHPEEETGPAYDAILGVQGKTPQYGILGELSGRKIALDLNQTHTISLFGVQGGGKSYTLGSIIEMACLAIPHLNVLPSPLATVIFHYSPTEDYKPEFTSLTHPNSAADQLAVLQERYGA
ncbi:hypothetical protein NKDENANG_01161 [Candidatus Entotheonellaceae bacterium PAL068K]